MSLKNFLIICCILNANIISSYSQNRVVISNQNDQQAHESAVLELISDSRGFLLPRMDFDSRDNIYDPAESLLIFNDENKCFEIHVEGEWHQIWCQEPYGCGDYVSHGDYDYATVQIGNQCWFAENLRYDNGCSKEEWVNNVDDPWCGFHEEDTEEVYGLLYRWKALMDGSTEPGAQGLCPDSWRIPTHDEWTDLERYVCNQAGNPDCETMFPKDTLTEGWDGTDEGKILKSCITDNASAPPVDTCRTDTHPRWDGDGTHYGIDDYGFAALPGGIRASTGSFSGYGTRITFQSSTIHWNYNELPDHTWVRHFLYNKSDISRNGNTHKGAFHARCMRDVH